MLRIAHLTDLHFNISNTNTGFGRGWLPGGIWAKSVRNNRVSSLCRALNAASEGGHDYLVFTGDLINRNDPASVREGITLVEEIAKHLGVPNHRIVACLGNHDFGGKTLAKSEARKQEMLDLISKRRWVTIESNSKSWRIKRLRRNAILLILDSRVSADDGAYPAHRILSAEEQQTILLGLQKHVTNETFLYVISHDVPKVKIGTTGSVVIEPIEADRPWGHGGNIIRLIRDNLAPARTLWMSGDAHNASEGIATVGTIDISPAGQLNVTEASVVNHGGKFGIAPEPERWPRARTIKFDSDKGRFVSNDFVYVSDAMNASNETYLLHGTWRDLFSVKTPEYSPSLRVPGKRHTSNPRLQAKPEKAASDAKRSLTGKGPSTLKLEAISSGLNQSIHETVVRDKLLKLRFATTHSDEETLSWLPMGDILPIDGLLPRFAYLASEWLMKFLPKTHKAGDTLVLGLDVWGGMIAAQIGVQLGTGSTVVYSPKRRPWSDRSEDFRTVRENISKKGNIVLVTDAVATGNTLLDVLKELKHIAPRAKFFVVTFIFNSLLVEKLQSSPDLKNVNIGAGCDQLPLLGRTVLSLPSMKSVFQ